MIITLWHMLCIVNGISIYPNQRIIFFECINTTAMKRSISKSLLASVVLVAAIIFSSLPTIAQTGTYQCNTHRSDYRKSNRRESHKHQNKKYRQHHRHYSKVRVKHCNRHDNIQLLNQYDCSRRIYYKRHGHRCYKHSRFGHVVVEFSRHPRIIEHCDGDFYYTKGRYYQHLPQIGYVRVDEPRSVYFDRIPDYCERISRRGRVCFKFDDLCFVKARRGFRLIGSIEL